MATIAAMSRAVSDKHKVQGNSLPEITVAWRQCSLDLGGDPDVRDAARGALRDGNLLVAFLLDSLSRTDDERKERAVRGLRILERLKDRDEPLDLRKIDRESFRDMGDPDRDDRAPRVVRPKGVTRPRGPSETKSSKRIG